MKATVAVVIVVLVGMAAGYAVGQEKVALPAIECRSLTVKDDDGVVRGRVDQSGLVLYDPKGKRVAEITTVGVRTLKLFAEDGEKAMVEVVVWKTGASQLEIKSTAGAGVKLTATKEGRVRWQDQGGDTQTAVGK